MELVQKVCWGLTVKIKIMKVSHLLVCSLTPHPNFAMNLLVLFCTYCSEENKLMIDQAHYCL